MIGHAFWRPSFRLILTPMWYPMWSVGVLGTTPHVSGVFLCFFCLQLANCSWFAAWWFQPHAVHIGEHHPRERKHKHGWNHQIIDSGIQLLFRLVAYGDSDLIDYPQSLTIYEPLLLLTNQYQPISVASGDSDQSCQATPDWRGSRNSPHSAWVMTKRSSSHEWCGS